jgi:hypothetical protein
MRPAPVGVKHNGLCRARAAAAGGASLNRERRVSLSGVCADLLRRYNRCESKREESCLREHSEVDVLTVLTDAVSSSSTYTFYSRVGRRLSGAASEKAS